ncbi:sigma-54-dependent Fis family transcriptional regulator [Nostocoides sp. HKS02]|uniref:sigma-54-dependent Fis family transcriptional regulator n=1 Tax=Nostocoides sp. HKS02 TaxID=1813880 RepID=UPI0012B441DD|nr:helix-turn-helix domain-containing protein [Tetrasphaera sp. HKS02]QGN58818.1 transcriptional regulator [Tetrasphaera sp. HKS02]
MDDSRVSGDTGDRRLTIAAARADFLSTGERSLAGVPDHVAASWRRSASAGLTSHGLKVRYFQDLDVRSRLVRCAEPIIQRISEETADLALSIVLTDSRARVISRVDTSRTIGLLLDRVSLAQGFGYAENEAGTNGIGTVLESGASVQIVGAEHYVDVLQPFACAGAAIRDPVTGRVEGVLDVTCLTEHSSPLMHSLVRSAARNIEQSLVADHSQCQQALFETYLRVDARSHEAVMAVGQSLVMMNAAAQLLLDTEEQAVLQEHARFLMVRHDAPDDRVELDSGKSFRLRGSRIMVGKDIAGMVLVITLLTDLPATGPSLQDYVLPAPGALSWPQDRGLIERLPLKRTPIAEGRTPSWRVAVHKIEGALRERAPLLVMGESGCGKLTLLTELYHAVHDGGRSLRFDAAQISRTGYVEAEEALQVTTRPTLYIFRNIDELTTEGVERLATFMMAAVETDLPVYVAATLSDASLDSELPFRELLPFFQTAVTVPPLRHRTADIGSLVERLLADLAPHRDVRLTPVALRLITRYAWPRNVSQLSEALSSALLKRPVGAIEEQDLPGYCHTTARRTLTTIEQAERDAIIAALQAAGGNRLQAAKALGLARSSLYRKLKQFGITTI